MRDRLCSSNGAIRRHINVFVDGERASSGSRAALAIETSGLVKLYGDTRALDAISFRVAPGELFGFLGPNGAGKTTTIRILATLLRPTAGTARVAGFDVATQPHEV